MSDTEAHKFAVKCVADIVEDLTGRRGLKNAFETIDDDIQAEIVGKWGGIIFDHIKSLGWLSPSDLSTRDAAVTQRALQMAGSEMRDIVSDIRNDEFWTDGNCTWSTFLVDKFKDHADGKSPPSSPSPMPLLDM